MYMMHPFCNISTSNNFYDQSRVLEDYYNYYYPSPNLFPTSPSLLHGDADFFHGVLENHHQMIQQQNPEENNTNNNENYDDDANDNDNKSKRVGFNEINSPKKRISKKDRHTKVDTAQGPRDRRMRLSLGVARKFFYLQDMLGFDKASKTIEWLLTKSLSAINELSRSFQQQVGANSSVSPTSGIEMDELSSTSGKLGKGRHSNKNSGRTKPKKKPIRPIRPLAKKSRDKARERARERTKEKMNTLQKKRGLAAVVGNGSSLVGAGSWIPSTTYHNLQKSDGIIPQLTVNELEHLSGNLGEAIIW